MLAKELLLSQFDLHHVLYNNVLKDISDDEASNSLLLPMNDIKFLAGHLVWAQRNLGRRIGVEFDIPWIDLFQRGTVTQGETADRSGLPELPQIIDKWNEITSIIREAFVNLSEEKLIAIEGKPVLPQFPASLIGMWAFINHHQAYTIGQIGILRRGLHKEPMGYFQS